MTGAATESYGDLLVTSVVVLAVVCVAAFVLVRVAGRWLTTGRSKGAQLMDIIARMPLEPRRSLYVVAVGGKTLLVGTSEMGMSLLTELDGHEVQARAPERASFSDLVRSAWLRRKGLGDSASGQASDGAATADSLATSRYGAAAAAESSAHVGTTPSRAAAAGNARAPGGANASRGSAEPSNDREPLRTAAAESSAHVSTTPSAAPGDAGPPGGANASRGSAEPSDDREPLRPAAGSTAHVGTASSRTTAAAGAPGGANASRGSAEPSNDREPLRTGNPPDSTAHVGATPSGAAAAGDARAPGGANASRSSAEPSTGDPVASGVKASSEGEAT